VLEVVDIEYIRKKYYVEGWSIRKISKQLGYARQTIRKALASSKIPEYELAKARPCPVMDPYREIILNWLRQDEKAPKSKGIPPSVFMTGWLKSTVFRAVIPRSGNMFANFAR